jgi:putative transposase
MPRTRRIIVSDVPYHITQRGNNSQDVFFVDDDRQVYIKFLKKQADRFGMEVQGYCLMTNHVHLIATPKNENSLAKAIGVTNFIYTQYINRMHKRSGHLWQGRFYSCPLDEQHFWRALRYVECNPVRAKLVRFAWDYHWSSAAIHIGKGNGNGLIDKRKWLDTCAEMNWEQVLCQSQTDDEVEHIRGGTYRGKPLGSDSFVSKIEHFLGRRVRPLPVGRPKRKEQEKEE